MISACRAEKRMRLARQASHQIGDPEPF